MRYNGNVITDATAFRGWWKRLANEFVSSFMLLILITNKR